MMIIIIIISITITFIIIITSIIIPGKGLSLGFSLSGPTSGEGFGDRGHVQTGPAEYSMWIFSCKYAVILHVTLQKCR